MDDKIKQGINFGFEFNFEPPDMTYEEAIRLTSHEIKTEMMMPEARREQYCFATCEILFLSSYRLCEARRQLCCTRNAYT
ncbi:MAG: hypothetical protein EZS28_021605 [Streblomastix strix]|uniref:Uncharacterized protein n=1 Tax=Streblomastix strix TaxID=222440 RepID=A0A5J4VJU2_9EUKA|nr:MAG: hypothetical protein EZS28_021604 [Streblomastix strix]KAA6382869.1 MAG: hypothetical protein EZS28_021605 [Streblomastix strix]